MATVDALGIEGELSGDEFVARCPMHLARTGKEDRSPSWSINTSSGLFLCFSCGYSGSVVRLIADMKNVPVSDARTMTVKPDLATTISRMSPGPVTYRRPTISEAMLGRFIEPPAWALDARGLTAEACAVYRVLWDQDTDSWITPIREAGTGTLMGWQQKGQRSRLFRNVPLGVQKAQTLFGYDVFTGGAMLVVESPLDAVRAHSIGIPGAVATFGAHVSTQQVRLMTAADEVVFALDNPRVDAAGKKASLHLLSESRGALKSVRFFRYSTDDKDIGDMSPEAVHAGIDGALSRALGERAVLGV